MTMQDQNKIKKQICEDIDKASSQIMDLLKEQWTIAAPSPDFQIFCKVSGLLLEAKELMKERIDETEE